MGLIRSLSERATNLAQLLLLGRYILPLGIIIFLVDPQSLAASPQHYRAYGRFEDGGSFSGTFVFDPATKTFDDMFFVSGKGPRFEDFQYRTDDVISNENLSLTLDHELRRVLTLYFDDAILSGESPIGGDEFELGLGFRQLAEAKAVLIPDPIMKPAEQP